MCAVLFSQPIPVKNLFRTGLPRKINVFPRTSAYFRRDKKKKMATEEENWPTSLLLVPSPWILPPFNRGKQVSS